MLYAAVERMRLVSSPQLVSAAQQVVKHVMVAYAAPDRTFKEMHARLHGGENLDQLQAFTEVCRKDLKGLSV